MNPTLSMRLDNRRALITGGGTGLGQAIAHAFAQAGASVALAGRRAEPLETTAQAIRAAGGEASTHAIDVTDLAAFTALCNELAPFHVFVNNAGMNTPQPFLEVTPEVYDTVMNVNLRAAFFAAQAAAKAMVAHKIKGAIINMSSQLGRVAYEDRSVYVTSKHALEGLNKSLGLELAPYGIRSNAIGPTYIRTPLTEPLLADPLFRERTLARLPIGRFGEPEEIAGAAVFLASDAAAMITGTSLAIDGGWTAI